ncbi:MAG: hypothetical protein JSS02_20705 [Planctomycetes bacterium]|nr:hypothetical protein [Planctomycetota bacterium]
MTLRVAEKGKTAQQVIIDLRFDNNAGRVRVVFPDKHLQVMAVEAAVRACGVYRDQIQFGVQFDELLGRLAAWSEARQSDLAETYLTTRNGGLLFLAVWSKAGYVVECEDALTELDMGIANEGSFDLIRLSVLGVPPCSKEGLCSLLSPHTQIRIWKNGD